MTTVTARAVLFGDADPAAALGANQGWHGLLGRLGGVLGPVSDGGRRAVDTQLAGALGGLLELDLGQILVGGWRRHRALVAAAQATRANPAASEVVQLATHQITTAHHPYLDLVVNGVKLATLRFDLELTVDVDGLVATVRQGRLVEVHGGRCTVTAGLAAEGVPLASRQVVLDPALAVPLGQGVPID